MSATWLPGCHDPGRTVVRDDLGIPTRDFAMDPSQDLMVLFKGGGGDVGLPVMVVFPGTLELHIRTISTNQTHPEARVPVLCTPVMYPITSGFVQIVDDVVGMMYCVDPARPRITIWNWKTGNRVVDRSSDSLPPGTWDFNFIHSRALFVTTGNGGGSLELFTFTCDRADTDANGNANSDSDSDTPTPTQLQPHHTTPTSTLTHAATLHLPPIRKSVRVLSISSHTGPFLAGCPPDKPFVASNEERIHVLTIQYVHLPTLDGPRTRPRVCVFVHNRALEGYVDRGVASATMGAGEATTGMVVPWREWGRVHTRMLPHVGRFQWLRYVHGQRVVMLLPTSEADKSTLQVLDFNVRSALDDNEDEDDVGADADADHTDEGTGREKNEKNKDDADPSLRKTTLKRVTYPIRIAMPHIFVDVVETGLPYREARRDVRGDYSGVMIDDERLVGLKYPAFLTQDMKEIDVFTM
ncbi:hypothetical protein J3R82DRAFT_7515 [Butyriboletus roseoflavus]|nr:hypothetical protein J3R82DRAFT_7515 [Butyriboletus roseoflavus]